MKRYNFLHLKLLTMKTCDTTTYQNLKPQYPNTILWFLVGEFYQAYEQDAETTAAIIGIHLYDAADKNKKPVKLIGFPQYALDPYLSKMVKAGISVGVCQQLETPPKQGIQPTLF